MRRKTQRLGRSIAFVACVLLSIIVTTLGSSGDSTPAQPKGKGRVTIVYQDDAILPENLDAIKKIRDSGVFERMADRLTKALALPHDLQVIVTDKTPKGFDDPTTSANKRARTSKTRTRSCLPRSGRFAAGSETAIRR